MKKKEEKLSKDRTLRNAGTPVNIVVQGEDDESILTKDDSSDMSESKR